MKCGQSTKTIHKEVVIIGNGPSGISLSYMLAGNTAHLTSTQHPDELLAARLAHHATEGALVHQDMGYLAHGLDGRTTNPISLLFDALAHPYADVGFDLAPLVEWAKTEPEIDHVVLGKGPPGGSWHTMDPHVLTLSLGAWMALPGLPFPANADDDTTTRASASQVAAYYQNYVTQMGLQSHFHNNVIVTRIQAIHTDDNNNNNIKQTNNHSNTTTLSRTNPKTSTHNNSKHTHWLQRFKQEKCQQFNSLLLPPPRRIITKCLRFYRITDENIEPMECNINIYRMLLCDKKKNLTNCENNNNNNDGKLQDHNLNNNQLSPFRRCKQIQCDKYCDKTNSRTNSQAKWVVETYNKLTRDTVSYTCNSLVLANGANDLPNRLALKSTSSSGATEEMSVEPVWLVHDVRSLEIELDLYKSVRGRKDSGMSNMDPVLIVGAGLSAADAIIATRKRNIPVLHVFRSKSSDLIRKLPKNMYPEYHKIHEMMLNTTTTYPNYTALPEHTIDTISDTTHTVTLTHKPSVTTVTCHKSQYTYRVSFAAVLIGSRPDLSFLPPHYNLATSNNANNSLATSDKINNSLPTSDKTNNNILRIDKVTHGVVGYEGLYALGPLAGDKFVRFIPGGALAVMSDLYKKGSHLQRVG